MAQIGYTPIQLYRTTTAGAVPDAGNLNPGELGFNINDADMALYAENATGVVKRLINNPAGLKYPTADGTIDQVLKTDGAGNLSFSSVAGGVSLSGTNTWTGAQTFTNSLMKLLGSSTGVTTLASANAGATNYTITFPASTGTVLTTAAAVTVAQGGTGVATLTGLAKGNGTGAFTAATANSDYLVPALANTAVTGIKTATFNSQTTIATTTGAITVNWTTAQNQLQTEPTGAITYTFTAPPGPCHLQLIINSDGTSTAQTITWPASVVWLGATWAGVANKKSVINFWYDGSSYFAIGSNQV